MSFEKIFSKYFILFFSKFLFSIFSNFDKVQILSFKKSKFLPFVLFFLKKSSFFKFEQLIDYTVVHNIEKRFFELKIMLLSVQFNNRLNITCLAESQESLYSLTSLFKSANWAEREIYDMFGIYFLNHPDLRRILTDYGFSNHPLQKDYPLSGYVELFYSDVLKSIHTDKNVIKNFLKSK